MSLKLIKTETEVPCHNCGSKDLRLTFLGTKYCALCQTYVYKDLRDIDKKRK